MADWHDPKVSQRYRQLGAEEPSRELDQTILAAAHRAADKPHAPLVTPAGRHRWYFSLGAAAILVLAVAVTVHMERSQPDAETVVLKEQPIQQAPPPKEESAPIARVEPKKEVRPAKPRASVPAAAPPAEPAAPPPAESAAPRRESADVTRSDRFEANQAEPQVAPTQAPPRERTWQSRTGESPGLLRNEARRAPAPELSAPRAKGEESQVAAAAAVPLTAERLLERIAELRKEGRHNEADQLLAEFRQRYPDYRISEEMVRKVERKK